MSTRSVIGSLHDCTLPPATSRRVGFPAAPPERSAILFSGACARGQRLLDTPCAQTALDRVEIVVVDRVADGHSRYVKERGNVKWVMTGGGVFWNEIAKQRDNPTAPVRNRSRRT